MRVSTIRRNSQLVRGEPLHPDNATACWMIKHHGDLSQRQHLPWRAEEEYRAPLVVAMWFISPFHTGDHIGPRVYYWFLLKYTLLVATLYMTERGTSMVAYLCESREGTFDVDATLHRIHQDVALWWRNGACGIRISQYVEALERLYNAERKIYNQLAVDSGHASCFKVETCPVSNTWRSFCKTKESGASSCQSTRWGCVFASCIDPWCLSVYHTSQGASGPLLFNSCKTWCGCCISQIQGW